MSAGKTTDGRILDLDHISYEGVGDGIADAAPTGFYRWVGEIDATYRAFTEKIHLGSFDLRQAESTVRSFVEQCEEPLPKLAPGKVFRQRLQVILKDAVANLEALAEQVLPDQDDQAPQE